MCGRYASLLPPEFIARLFATLGDIPNTPPSWNVAPTDTALVVRRHPQIGERRLDALRRGLVPSYTGSPEGSPPTASAAALCPPPIACYRLIT